MGGLILGLEPGSRAFDRPSDRAEGAFLGQRQRIEAEPAEGHAGRFAREPDLGPGGGTDSDPRRKSRTKITIPIEIVENDEKSMDQSFKMEHHRGKVVTLVRPIGLPACSPVG
jgi:hypothetical protein